MLEIKIDAKQLLRLERTVRDIKNGVAKVLAPAINRALANGATTVKREIRKVYTIKAKDIPVKVKKASTNHPVGAVVLADSMLPLEKFQLSGGTRRRPLRAVVKRGHGGIIKSGFMATMPTGHTGAFRRKGPPRLPIKSLLTISAPIMASQPNVAPAVTASMAATLSKRIDHEIKRIMDKEGR
jgi:hypothetical protein